jgi:anti-sigma-K factor RskA
MNDAPRPELDPTSPELDELLGAFALDALEVDERARVADYADRHASARREIDELRETAAMLALTAGEHEAAPAELWERISAAVSRAAPEHAPPSDLAARRQARSVPLQVVAPLAAAAAIVLAVLAARVVGDDETNSLAGAYSDLAARGTTVDMTGASVASVALADGRGILRTDTLSALDDGRIYQAWAVYPDGDPISIGVLDDATDYAEFRYSEDLVAVAITVEDTPGVVVTDKKPIAAGEVS